MARQPRIDFDGAWHHVMNRGASHQLVFLDDQDRAMFLAVVAEAVRRFGIEVHAYCLMPNHYHLLIRSPTTQLSRSMKHIGQVYTQRFNRRHGRDGALFRGRFHSILVDSDSYLDNVSRYIHRNPVPKDTNEVRILDEFQWSSLAACEQRATTPEWLTTSEVLANFTAPFSYEKFVRSDTMDQTTSRFYEDPFRQRRAFGRPDFVDRVRHPVRRSRRHASTARPERRRGAAESVERPWGLTPTVD